MDIGDGRRLRRIKKNAARAGEKKSSLRRRTSRSWAPWLLCKPPRELLLGYRAAEFAFPNAPGKDEVDLPILHLLVQLHRGHQFLALVLVYAHPGRQAGSFEKGLNAIGFTPEGSQFEKPRASLSMQWLASRCLP